VVIDQDKYKAMTAEEAGKKIANAVGTILQRHFGPVSSIEDVEAVEVYITEIIQAQRQAAVEEYKQSQWQPIETAPKDGTEVLLYEKGSINIGCYDWCEFENGSFKHWTGLSDSLENPTHWQPLPTPPQEQGEGV
jgi:hypothetical protein